MLVRMIWQMSGTRGDGKDWAGPGEPMNLPEHEARSMIERGAAVPMVEERAVETADAPVDPAVEVRATAAAGGYVPNTVQEDPEPEVSVKRGPGRPPGKKNGD